MPDWTELCRLDCRVWDLLLLRGNPAAEKLSGYELLHCLEQADNWGRETATRMAKDNIHDLLQEDQIRLFRQEQNHILGVHSEYRWNSSGAEIHLYLPVIHQLYKLVLPHDPEMTQASLEDLHLAHEYFHHLVHSGRTAPPAEMQPDHPRLARRLMNTLEEAAAHAFARQVQGFSCHPLALDWLLMEEQETMRAERILQEAIARTKKLERSIP